MKLYGKHATEEEITKEISRLLLGDPYRRQAPLTISDAARTLGYTRSTIYFYVKKAVEKYHILEYDDSRRIKIPEKPETEFQRFGKYHDITNDPPVSDWKQDLLTRKNGEPLASWKARILALESVCNTCMVNPRDLLISQKQTERIFKNYADLYRQGRVQKQPNGRKKTTDDIRNVIYQKAQGVRDFCGFYGMIWKRGAGGVMSQKVPNHGKYADKRLTDEELERADQFIKEKWGLDSDAYRWFWIGIESCARFSALYNMSLDYTKHVNRKTGRTTYIMTAYESKTKQIKGGRWIKYITRPDTQKSIDLLKARGGTRIYEPCKAKETFTLEIRKNMREIFSFLGKTGYFLDHPVHVLRHIGAHYWLAKTNYNYGIVSVIGGWNTIDELKKSYGEIPPEKVLEMVEEENDKTRENSLLYL